MMFGCCSVFALGFHIIFANKHALFLYDCFCIIPIFFFLVQVYYYNQETGESAWDKPAEMVSFVAPKGRGW